MAEAGGVQADGVVPNPRIPKVMGILNIVFASGLILAGLCMGVATAMQPYLNKAMGNIQKKVEADTAKRQKADIEAIEADEKEAKTDSEKQALRERRIAIEVRPRSPTPMGSFDFNKLKLNEPKLQIYGWVDVGTAILLNLLMLAAGIGLVQRKMWGLRLGVWTALAKIVRLLLLYSFFALAIVPGLAQTLGKLVAEQMGQTGGPSLDVRTLIQIYYVTYTAVAVGMIVFGSIYPAISLWILTRPGARAACDESRMPPGQELNESW
jgi:hypothetical protein